MGDVYYTLYVPLPWYMINSVLIVLTIKHYCCHGAVFLLSDVRIAHFITHHYSIVLSRAETNSSKLCLVSLHLDSN